VQRGIRAHAPHDLLAIFRAGEHLELERSFPNGLFPAVAKQPHEAVIDRLDQPILHPADDQRIGCGIEGLVEAFLGDSQCFFRANMPGDLTPE
jgi:hypothetical protein